MAPETIPFNNACQLAAQEDIALHLHAVLEKNAQPFVVTPSAKSPEPTTVRRSEQR